MLGILLIIHLFSNALVSLVWSFRNQWANCLLLISDIQFQVSYSFGECIGVCDDFANLAIEARLEANGYLMHRFTGQLSLSFVLAL